MTEIHEQHQQNRVEKTRQVAGMFDRIAPTYDLLNGILSAGQHLRWARRMIRIAAPEKNENWLDIATGSGPLILEGKRLQPASNWVGVDPSRELLRRGQERSEMDESVLVMGVGEHLPFADRVFSGITIAYGLRNFADPVAGLHEMHRVLRPNGKLHILEFHPAKKQGGWGKGGLVQFYLEKVLPFIGRVVSGDAAAYRYLSETAGNFWTLETLNAHLDKIGFEQVQQVSWMGASVTLTVARRKG